MKTNQKFTVLRLLVLGVMLAGLNAKAAECAGPPGKIHSGLCDSLGPGDAAGGRLFLYAGQRLLRQRGHSLSWDENRSADSNSRYELSSSRAVPRSLRKTGLSAR